MGWKTSSYAKEVPTRQSEQLMDSHHAFQSHD